MNQIEKSQREVLNKLVSAASTTEYGRTHQFSSIKSYEAYKADNKLTQHSDFFDQINRMKAGEPDVLWPGKVTRYSLSAGTTGKPKAIPMPDDRIKSDRRFTQKVFLSYLRNNPNFFKIIGQHLSLPGALETDENYPGITVGEVSGYLATTAPWYLKKMQILSPDELAHMAFKEKFEFASEKALISDVKVISALPSYTLRFMQLLLEKSGKDSIRDIWPSLKIIVSGGEPLSSYKKHMLALCKGLDIRFLENYGASEGIFAFNTDNSRTDLQLVYNNDVFMEWIPDPSADKDELLRQEAIPLWQVETGVKYAIVVTSNSGLWRYCMNDLVEFTDTSLMRMKVTGRVTDVLDLFGEKIDSIQAKEALMYAASRTGAEFSSFSLGVSFENERDRIYHAWFVQWLKEPENRDLFMDLVDEYLVENNRSYHIRRTSESYNKPRLFDTNSKIITEWKQKFLGQKGQSKMPVIIHDQEKTRDLIDRSSGILVIK